MHCLKARAMGATRLLLALQLAVPALAFLQVIDKTGIGVRMQSRAGLTLLAAGRRHPSHV